MTKNSEILKIIYKVSDNIEYKIDKNGTVTIYEKQDHKIQRFFRKLKFKIPAYKSIELDEYSSYVFTQINGKNSVEDIGENLEIKYGEKVNPVFERLLIFLNHININCKCIEKIN